MNEKVILASGAELELQPCEFKDALALQQLAVKEIVATQSGDTDVMKAVLFSALSSPEMEKMFWVCAKGCLYKNQRISKELFEDEKVREDYVQVYTEVLRFTLAPFMKNAPCALKAFAEKMAAIFIQK